MIDLLNDPAVQSAGVPFVIALALGCALVGTRYLALAVVSGLVVVLALTIGFSIEPLTAVKKLVIAAFGATAIALVLEAASIDASRAVAAALAVATGLAAVWVLQRVLAQHDAPRAWAIGFAAFALTAATTGTSVVAGAASSLRAAVIGACLGWGSGVLALLVRPPS